MNTPIFDFLTQLKNSNISRCYMPGHKGNHPTPLLNEISRYDITEITGADSLFEADGIISQSEKNSSALYGTKHTSFCTGGSTLCIQTMLALVASPKDTVIAARNAHLAFINTCALLDITPYWVQPCYNDSFGVSGEIIASDIESALIASPNAKAVYITTPDYLGCMSDVKAIATVCKKYNKLLIVDNAHGAHLKFTENDLHPITLGATLCCDSAHKTLPVFTGGAYLHISKDSNIKKETVKSKMSIFGSTSPSYLIMLSLDLNNKYLAQQASSDFLALAEKISKLDAIAQIKGFTPISARHDLTKLTLNGYHVGITGKQLAHYFRSCGIEYEYAGEQHVVFMLSPQNLPSDFEKIQYAIENITPQKPIEMGKFDLSIPKVGMSVRQATFCDKESIPIDKAFGRIAGETKIKCPPGVPLIIAGEIIDKNIQKLLKRSSILSINVVK